MFKDISFALKAVHEAGYIYKDIKPDNIMFSGEHYKLIDFGSIVELNKKKNIGGCWLYKDPEIISYACKKVLDYDCKSDIWPLAVMVCHLYLGKFPYDCFDYDVGRLLPLGDILENQLEFCEHVPNIEPVVFRDIILKCVVFDPLDRINSCQLCKELKKLTAE